MRTPQIFLLITSAQLNIPHPPLSTFFIFASLETQLGYNFLFYFLAGLNSDIATPSPMCLKLVHFVAFDRVVSTSVSNLNQNRKFPPPLTSLSCIYRTFCSHNSTRIEGLSKPPNSKGTYTSFVKISFHVLSHSYIIHSSPSCE